jgi:hypothetical protein
MIIKFDSPLTIENARYLYNDTVKFITDTSGYPNVTAIEFDGDPQLIFRKRALDPKVTKQSDKIINRYEKRLTSIWNRSFKNIINVFSETKKQEQIVVTEEDKKRVKDYLDQMTNELSDSAYKPYKDAFKLGKIRGQIISRQEIDDDVTDEDDKSLEKELDDNEQYLVAFSNDLQTDLDQIMEQPYDNYEELQAAIKTKVQEKKKSRVLKYAMAIIGLVVLGMVTTLRQAREEEGHVRHHGGIWTLHPNEGNGGPVCEGCMENEGQFFTLEEFEAEHGTNDCINNCRCDLDFSRNE